MSGQGLAQQIRGNAAACALDGCMRPTRGRGMCPMHAARLRRQGDTGEVGSRITFGRSIEERFWEKVDMSAGPDGCWPWTAHIGSGRFGGYGGFRVGQQNRRAHVLAYELSVGPVPVGLVLDHLCHDAATCHGGPCQHRRCCNPKHLAAVTSRQNSQRSAWAARKECPAGHPLPAPDANGRRVCLVCHNRRTREYHARTRGAARAARRAAA